MAYIKFNHLRVALAGVALGLAFLTPVVAHAQFNVNSLAGKNHAQVLKMLGQPLSVSGAPINYARFNASGAVSTQVWYKFDTGITTKIQVVVLAKPGMTVDSVLRSYGLAIGPNPKKVEVVPPAISEVNNTSVPGAHWGRIFVSYLYAMPFKTDVVNYCHQHHLDPNKTYFWTIQVSGSPRSGMMTDGEGGGGHGGHKGGKGGKRSH